MRTNRAARQCLARLLHEQPGPQQAAMLMARIAAALAENLEALQELAEIQGIRAE